MDTKMTHDEEMEYPFESSVDEERKSYSDLMTPSPTAEAGGVAWTTLYGDGFTINLTARAGNCMDALDDLVLGIQYGKKTYKLDTKPTTAQAPVQAAPVAPAVVAPAPVPPAPVQAPVPPAPVQAAPVQAAPVPPPVNPPPDVNTFVAVKMTVEPRTDGKSKISLFADGHQWADINLIFSPEQAVGTLGHLAPWTQEHFMTATTYDVKYLVAWKNSTKLNSAGNPYKNLVSVTQA